MTEEVTYNGYWYEVGGWTFEDDDRDLAYIDSALEAWSRWRDHVVENQDATGA